MDAEKRTVGHNGVKLEMNIFLFFFFTDIDKKPYGNIFAFLKNQDAFKVNRFFTFDVRFYQFWILE